MNHSRQVFVFFGVISTTLVGLLTFVNQFKPVKICLDTEIAGNILFLRKQFSISQKKSSDCRDCNEPAALIASIEPQRDELIFPTDGENQESRTKVPIAKLSVKPEKVLARTQTEEIKSSGNNLHVPANRDFPDEKNKVHKIQKDVPVLSSAIFTRHFAFVQPTLKTESSDKNKLTIEAIALDRPGDYEKHYKYCCCRHYNLRKLFGPRINIFIPRESKPAE